MGVTKLPVISNGLFVNNTTFSITEMQFISS